MVHPDDQHKLTVITFRGQETFKIPVIGYKNSPAYTQHQINRILRPHKKYTRAFVDDIVIHSKTLRNHLKHLKAIFSLFTKINLSINPTKTFISYPTTQLLSQQINSLGLSTAEDKLKTISLLKFPHTLHKLETYLEITDYLRDYIPYYARIAEPLQNQKTFLLKGSPSISRQKRKNYTAKTQVLDPTEEELNAFKLLQEILSSPNYLIHIDFTRCLYIDLNASKKNGFGAIIYHIRDENKVFTNSGAGLPGIFTSKKASGASSFPSKSDIQPIMFLSKTLSKTKRNYGATELKMAGMV